MATIRIGPCPSSPRRWSGVYLAENRAAGNARKMHSHQLPANLEVQRGGRHVIIGFRTMLHRLIRHYQLADRIATTQNKTFLRKHITMADSPDDLAAALATIRSACLPHPDGEFLECFLNESVHPSRAAAYLLQRCPSGADASALASFLSDWKRLVTICKYF